MKGGVSFSLSKLPELIKKKCALGITIYLTFPINNKIIDLLSLIPIRLPFLLKHRAYVIYILHAYLARNSQLATRNFRSTLIILRIDMTHLLNILNPLKIAPVSKSTRPCALFLIYIAYCHEPRQSLLRGFLSDYSNRICVFAGDF